MKAAFEKIQKDSEASFVCQESKVPSFDSPYHYHPELEIALVVASSGQRLVGDHVGRFGEGDFVLHGANLPHAYYNDSNFRGIAHSRIIQFREDCLGNSFFDVAEMSQIKALLQKAKRGLWFKGETRQEAMERLELIFMAEGPQKITHFIGLLDSLSCSTEYEYLASEYFSPGLNSHQAERINRVCEFIHSHFKETITQVETAAKINMSPPAFSRFFHRITGKTFTEFLNEVRIGYACHRLTHSEESVVQICYDSGYQNLSNFNRRFRELRQMTPSAYRKTFQGISSGVFR